MGLLYLISVRPPRLSRNASLLTAYSEARRDYGNL